MEKTIILLTIVLASLNFLNVQAQPEKVSPNEIYISPAGFSQDDSLLFDGNYNSINKPANNSDDCKISVIYAIGTAEGTRYVTEIYTICGQIDTSVNTKKGLVQTGDKLKFGEEITTGDNSRLNIELSDGSEIRMGPNSKVTITEEMCDQQTFVEQAKGYLWYKVKKLLGGAKYEVKLDKWLPGGVRGTEFTIEMKDNEVIIRVFEGAYEVYPPQNIGKKETFAKEMEQLTNDYNAGKITTEEFARKSQEITKNNDFMVEDMKNKMVTKGNMVRLTDKISEPVSFDLNENRWFDDANFMR
jgi:hypothetical protein